MIGEICKKSQNGFQLVSERFLSKCDITSDEMNVICAKSKIKVISI